MNETQTQSRSATGLLRAVAGPQYAAPAPDGIPNQPAAPRRKMRPSDCWVIRFRQIRKSMVKG